MYKKFIFLLSITQLSTAILSAAIFIKKFVQDEECDFSPFMFALTTLASVFSIENLYKLRKNH